MRGVSLTHVEKTMACVEVALTTDPARKNALIRYVFTFLENNDIFN